MKYEFFKNVTSKEELYSQYKRLAMEHHPDHGGRVCHYVITRPPRSWCYVETERD